MRGVGVRVGALLVCVVMGCTGWWVMTAVTASTASAHRASRRVAEPGVVLSRQGFAASRRELRAGERRVPGARHGSVPVRAGAQVAWRSRADSDTFQAASGRLETRIYPYAVNYRNASGRFVPIQAGLVAEHGGYRQRANDLGLRLPAAASGSARLAAAHGGVSLRLLGARGRGVVSGTSERFFDALSGVDLGYVSQNTGLGWEAQLNAASAARGLSFAVRGTRGLSARLVSGGVAFRDRKGGTVWVFKAPTLALAA